MALEGTVTAQKALQGSETRELLEGTKESNPPPDIGGHGFASKINGFFTKLMRRIELVTPVIPQHLALKREGAGDQ